MTKVLLGVNAFAWPVAFNAVGWSVAFVGMECEANAMMAAPRRAMRVPPARSRDAAAATMPPRRRALTF